jgi:starch phosphorylase
MVAMYTRRFYNPAAAKWRYLNDKAMANAKALAAWKANIKAAWAACSVKDVNVSISNGNGNELLNPKQPQFKVGAELTVEALISLGDIKPNDVSIEFYHGPVDAWGNIRNGSSVKMGYKQASNEAGEHWFVGSVPCRQTGQRGLAVRVLPNHPDLANPYELGLVLWESTGAKN